MTAPQNPITRAIWDGALPIKFSLDAGEADAAGANTIIEPYFIEAPRCSYFPLLTSQIRKYFTDLSLQFIGDDAEIWYDVDGTPLKWHYPIGLLFDLHTGYRPDSNSPPPLPWPVTVHFKNFPADKLIRAQAIDATQDFFMSMIKEADFLRNGSTKKVMNLSKNDQFIEDSLLSRKMLQYLNQAILTYQCTGDYDRFWSINYRLVMNDGQEPISPLSEDGKVLSLGAVLHRVLPDLFPSPTTNDSSTDAAPVIHGVISSLTVPIVEASQNLCYPDNFLHIVVLLGK
ncbi:1912_t:CDS:2 [Paraglomus brasilianum]|uniref:Autophagy protein 5 n=1 Tax=Paraglomus brasilianum TaxID=144538 RepID=A0A9N9EZU0_9GLOM|nr:1912_t:CDS:2 [Paraglomus brasilianum]